MLLKNPTTEAEVKFQKHPFLRLTAERTRMAHFVQYLVVLVRSEIAGVADWLVTAPLLIGASISQLIVGPALRVSPAVVHQTEISVDSGLNAGVQIFPAEVHNLSSRPANLLGVQSVCGVSVTGQFSHQPAAHSGILFLLAQSRLKPVWGAGHIDFPTARRSDVLAFIRTECSPVQIHSPI
jgi:hypothetical protein